MIKTDKRDKLFSKLVRARAGWRCERCGTPHEPNSVGLHCSHFVGRQKHATRWLPLNAFALCYGCHQYLGSRPQEHVAFVVSKRTAEEFAQLMILKHKTTKRWSEKQKEQIHRELKIEFAKLQAAEAGKGEFFGFSLPTAEGVLE